MDHSSIKRIDFVFHLEKAIENGEFEVLLPANYPHDIGVPLWI
jgi:hypothetical protein